MEDGLRARLPSLFSILHPLASLHFRARQERKQDQARCEYDDARQVRRRGPAAEVVLALGIISAEHFHKRAQQGITHQVSAEYLPVEFLAPIKPGQHCVEAQIEERLIDLGRMHWES